ncbi:uncharacterized protein YpmB [Geomicrobium halophilum]|uniref:Uncharacterized protein YpmB n=1 Tax=Geomicrobium halophilum TaxID=549000 RepID=A0A841PJM1_9BACL|nr:hypothetical protein [Geomicrobium halophilum]MBB6449067.1 uncharacterized protein YpmB [Geomicrobium halophilum]
MRLWLSLGIVLPVFFLGVGVFSFYQTINAPKNEQQEAIEHLVMNEDEAVEVEDFHMFFGIDTIYVATVSQDNGELYYWFYNDSYDRIERVPHADLVEADTLKNEVLESVAGAELRDIGVGYEEDEVVYELVYTDQDNTLYYDYYTATDGGGELLKQFRLSP